MCGFCFVYIYAFWGWGWAGPDCPPTPPTPPPNNTPHIHPTQPNPTKYSADLPTLALAAHVIDAPSGCLVADALLLPSPTANAPNAPNNPRLRLWAALAGGGDSNGDGGGGLAYTDLNPDNNPSPEPQRLTRLWAPPTDTPTAAAAAANALLLPSPREAASVLAARPLPPAVGMVGASAASAFSASSASEGDGGGGVGGGREGVLRQQLWALHQQLQLGVDGGSGGDSR